MPRAGNPMRLCGKCSHLAWVKVQTLAWRKRERAWRMLIPAPRSCLQHPWLLLTWLESLLTPPSAHCSSLLSHSYRRDSWPMCHLQRLPQVSLSTYAFSEAGRRPDTYWAARQRMCHPAVRHSRNEAGEPKVWMWVGRARPKSSARVLDCWWLSHYRWRPGILREKLLPKVGTWCCPRSLRPSLLPRKPLLQQCSVSQQRLHPQCTGPDSVTWWVFH